MTKLTGFAGGAFIAQTLQGSGGGGSQPNGILASTVGGLVLCKTPGAEVTVTFDWTDDIGADDTLVSVLNTMPTDLTKATETIDATAMTSTLHISGGTHGKIYQFTTQATLGSGQVITRVWPIRVFNG